ncbi:ImmA/IrrE family metallo-endopeptidase [Clostridium cellulovorans]|uniref:IrrE N-terminal-like domain-containing protein n=1 Tax=Clostridium cellulovorans (strain ATCC 35296 / DSM 3052 / OCM 3 / 743B) TaxID=573061 RepID=D9SSC7_CLOC7|nr:ImmA/IrrE family metallo-endopeptidase [Clostridium cellulovorans]ADL50524.1 protein of unknown function DUF955 [Clostridium cellulovorans 743B]
MSSSSNDVYYTLAKIPKHRQEHIAKRVKDFIKEYKIRKWPLDFVEIILQIQKEQSIPLHVQSITTLSNKVDATTVYSEEHRKFIVIVNRKKMQYPFKISKHRRLNFTLAHEIAHIYLGHHELPDECKSEEDIKIEELEADEFAGRLLMPKEKITTCNFTSIANVAEKFNVSEWAVFKRLSILNRRELNGSETFLVCENCENIEINPEDNYCKICGIHLEEGVRGITTMKYNDGYEINQDTNRVVTCPNCGNTDIEDHHHNCIICGQFLFNECSNDHDCGNINIPGNARYCPQCGATTNFKNTGLLRDWQLARGALLNKMEFEDDICGTSTVNKKIENWICLVFTLEAENYNILHTLLEGSTGKLCGDTLVIYVIDTNFKNKLSKDKYIDLIRVKAEAEFSIKIKDVKIATMEDFYPIIDLSKDNDLMF